MEKDAKFIERSNETVCRLFVELNRSLYKRLIEASTEYGMTKRDIVSEALQGWLNDRQSKV